MSVREVTYYVLHCDCCGKRADYGDYSAFSTREHAITAGGDDGFEEIDGKFFCRDCWMWPPDTADDDAPARAHKFHPKEVS